MREQIPAGPQPMGAGGSHSSWGPEFMGVYSPITACGNHNALGPLYPHGALPPPTPQPPPSVHSLAIRQKPWCWISQSFQI